MLWIVGAGGFGRETLDALLADGRSAEGFLDDHSPLSPVRGLPVHRIASAQPDDAYLIAIADPTIRARLVAQLQASGMQPTTVTHPRAIVGPETTRAPGTIILGGAYVSSSVTLGPHAHVNYNATVGHDVTTGESVTILPGANVGGSVTLHDRVLVGSNATILQGLTIGEGAVVGAGAVVTKEVPPHTTVVGTPARPIR